LPLTHTGGSEHVVKRGQARKYIPVYNLGGSLIEEKVNSMDMNSLTLILAFITIVPTVGGLIFQAMKDKRQADLDDKKALAEKERVEAQTEIDRANAASNASNAATNASNTTILTLQGENERLSKRIIELETSIYQKTEQIGVLMLAKIDAESDADTMKYKMETMQMKLNALSPTEKIGAAKKKKEDTVPLIVKQTLLVNEERKALVMEEMGKELETLKSGSITNGISHTTPIEGE
jgi:hypothetical protein